MENAEVIKRAKAYLKEFKTVELIWFTKEYLKVTKEGRDIDIINQALTDLPWYTNYNSHNPKDIAVKYSLNKKLNSIIVTVGGIVGLIGGLLGIAAYFR